jgi:hypothetical protein
MERIIIPIVLFVCLAGCTGNQDSASSEEDSVIRDTSTFIDEPDSTYVAETDAPEIVASMERLIDGVEQNAGQFTLRLSAKGYEYQTEQVWSFDSLRNLTHCYQQWASEGAEGKSHHFFRQESLYAIAEELEGGETKEMKMYHEELGGISFSGDGSASDSTAQPLGRKFFNDSEQELRKELAEIVKLLKENQSDITGEEDAQLTLETEGDVGKETTEISVDRRLLEDLLR